MILNAIRSSAYYGVERQEGFDSTGGCENFISRYTFFDFVSIETIDSAMIL